MTPTDTSQQSREPLVELMPDEAVLPALLQVAIEWKSSNAPDGDPQGSRTPLVEVLPEDAVLPALMQVAPPQEWTSSNSPPVTDSDLPG